MCGCEVRGEWGGQGRAGVDVGVKREVNRRTGACGCGCEVRGESGGQERVGVK